MNNILVIEDERDIADLVKVILEDEGYTVTILRNAESYNSDVHYYAPDLVLLDLNIAGFDGKIICRFIKNQNELKHIPVILMSANRDIYESKILCGADDLIQKPFDLQILLATVHRFLG